MKSPSSLYQKLLITRFPLKSDWGGEEGIHLKMAEIFRSHEIQTELLSSCPHLLKAFNEQKFCTKKEFQKDITSKVQLLLSILTVPFFFLRGIVWLGYFRFFRGIRTVLFLTFIEKITWTPIAKIYGMKVFWGHHAPLGPWFSRNPYLVLWKYYSQFATIVVASEFMKSQISLYATSHQNIRVIANISLLNNKFVQQENLKEDFLSLILQKTKQRISQEHTLFIGSTSRLSPEKGMEDLISAAAKLVHKNSNLIFLSAGTGPEKSSLQSLVRHKNLQRNFLFLGFLTTEELSLVLRCVDLFVCPSHQEPFGISILEAMSFQKAVIASCTGGIPEVLGKTNYGLFETKNRQSLQEKLQYFIDDTELRKTWEQKNHNRWNQYFAPDKFEDSILNTFFDQ